MDETQVVDTTTTDNQETTTTPTTDNTGVDNINPTTNKNNNETPKDEPKNPNDELPSCIEIYIYDTNGYFEGTNTADKSPLDDTYWMPPNATKERPPDVEKGNIQKFNGKTWDIVPISQAPKDEKDMSIDEKMINLTDKNNELMNQLNVQNDKITVLEQLVNGLIITGLNVNEGDDIGAK